MTWPVLSLRLETHPTNPPTPMGFVVCADGKHVGVLTIDQLRTAIAEWEQIDKGRKRK